MSKTRTGHPTQNRASKCRTGHPNTCGILNKVPAVRAVGLLKIYYYLLGQLDIRSYWLCGQFALDKTVDHITTENSTIGHLGIKFS